VTGDVKVSSHAGDQSIFVRRNDFKAVGGFNAGLAIMEDADLTIRLHEHGSYLQPGKVRHATVARQLDM
jgi:GT2 family glycosyltransferase